MIEFSLYILTIFVGCIFIRTLDSTRMIAEYHLSASFYIEKMGYIFESLHDVPYVRMYECLYES